MPATDQEVENLEEGKTPTYTFSEADQESFYENLHYVKQADGKYKSYKWSKDGKRWVGMQSGLDLPSGEKFVYDNSASFNAAQGEAEKKTTQYGAPSVSADDFIDAQGNPLPFDVVFANLKRKFPDKNTDELRAQIRDEMPQYEGVSKEEKGFAREGFQKDVYGISKKAGKAGQQMQKAYGGGMGSSMRGAVGAGKDIAQQFKQAEQGYAQDIYGLEKTAKSSFESDIGDWMSTAEFGKEGGYVFKDRSGIGKNTKSKKTFLDILSELPDAGGN